jgi:uncharacterized protein YkwD
MSERSGSFLQRCASVVATCVLVAALAGCAQVRARSAGGSSSTPPPTSTERQLIDAVNWFRGEHGLGALTVNSNLEDKARLWSAWMAGGGCGRNANGSPSICHSDLASGIIAGWSRLEENVASASPRTNIAGIISGLAQSKPHADNMLNTQITSIGVGVAYAGDAVYVAEEFMSR